MGWIFSPLNGCYVDFRMFNTLLKIILVCFFFLSGEIIFSNHLKGVEILCLTIPAVKGQKFQSTLAFIKYVYHIFYA